MNIEYYTKNVYGKEYMYIKDKATAVEVERLTGKKTVTAVAMDVLKKLGHEFVHVLPE